MSYTAFGEPILSDGQGGWTVGGELPPGFPRYAYASGWGYESDMLTLQGANTNLPPITLHHVGARWYQPAVGRFVQRDPLGVERGANVYVYAENTPTTNVDPDGFGIDSVRMSIWQAIVSGKYDYALDLIEVSAELLGVDDATLLRNAINAAKLRKKWIKQVCNLSLKKQKQRLKTLRKALKKHLKKYKNPKRVREVADLTFQVKYLDDLVGR